MQGLCQRIPTLEALLEKRENELRNILNDYGADRSEAHKLARAMHNLKRYTGKSAPSLFITQEERKKQIHFSGKAVLLF